MSDARGRPGASCGRTRHERTVSRAGARELHIVVACADRKSAPAGKPVRLRAIKARSLEERCSSWWRLLTSVSPSVSARELYVGDHWSVAKGLPLLARARGFAPRLWVASAGYGLVPEEAMLAPYSATFSAESVDSVATKAKYSSLATQHWWASLARRRLRGYDDPRSLLGLAETASAGSVMMVVASPLYIAAMEEDLSAVLSHAPHVRLLLVTSAPGPTSAALQQRWIPTTAPLRMSLGGALTSLHVRVARRLLEKLSPADLDVSTARRDIERLSASAPKVPKHHRERANDAAVRTFIRRALGEDPTCSHTRLLRSYRAAGRACEQGRFRQLFMTEKRAP
jgi:hypothetical protein